MDIKPSTYANGVSLPKTPAKTASTQIQQSAQASVQVAASSTKLSPNSLIRQEDFDHAIKNLQEEALEGFTKPKQGLFGISARIDVGRYNLYLVDQQVDTLKSQYGDDLDTDALKKQLIDSSGITTENPLKGSKRQNVFIKEMSLYHLKEKDVQALTDVYIYAKENNLDTEQVDRLGTVMASYRNDEAKYPGLFYPDKRKPYEPEVVEQAKAIYSNDGTGVVQFEEGFLDYALNPEKNLRFTTKMLNLDFFEQIAGTGDGEKAFLHTPLYRLGDGSALRPEGRLEKLKEALTKDPADIDTSNLSPEEAVKHYLNRWLETQVESESPMHQFIADLSQEDQMKIYTHLTLLKLL
ncbi:hypothetical protein [Oceanospirillum sediminis]|uniref:Uncharacterized protein n=1 Tax=Oceanospirillum sediminis TaxID=2760088 RepID=A0A839IM42_9GAMM|nr:hypothetical protein [Oceanospirillum sediminis]MBB1485961.1 hypothetical protein [Oceanospirillum sediminis]